MRDVNFMRGLTAHLVDHFYRRNEHGFGNLCVCELIIFCQKSQRKITFAPRTAAPYIPRQIYLCQIGPALSHISHI